MTTELWGVGQPLRGDDGAGVFVASRLARRPPEGLRVRVCETVPDNYLARLLRDPPELLLVVDAADLGLSPGTLVRLESPTGGEAIFSGTHDFPWDAQLRSLRDRLRLVFLLVQPRDRDLRVGLSPEVRRACLHLTGLLRRGRWDRLPPMETLPAEGGYHEKRSPR